MQHVTERATQCFNVPEMIIFKMNTDSNYLVIKSILLTLMLKHDLMNSSRNKQDVC